MATRYIRHVTPDGELRDVPFMPSAVWVEGYNPDCGGYAQAGGGCTVSLNGYDFKVSVDDSSCGEFGSRINYVVEIPGFCWIANVGSMEDFCIDSEEEQEEMSRSVWGVTGVNFYDLIDGSLDALWECVQHWSKYGPRSGCSPDDLLCAAAEHMECSNGTVAFQERKFSLLEAPVETIDDFAAPAIEKADGVHDCDGPCYRIFSLSWDHDPGSFPYDAPDNVVPGCLADIWGLLDEI